MSEFAPPQADAVSSEDVVSYELPTTGLSVLRSSGEIDDGWKIDPDYNPSDTLVRVTKTADNGDVLTKVVDRAALIELQKRVAAEKQKNVFKPPRPNAFYALGEAGESIGEAHAVISRAAELTAERMHEVGKFTPYTRKIVRKIADGEDVSGERSVNEFVVPDARIDVERFKPKV